MERWKATETARAGGVVGTFGTAVEATWTNRRDRLQRWMLERVTFYSKVTEEERSAINAGMESLDSLAPGSAWSMITPDGREYALFQEASQ